MPLTSITKDAATLTLVVVGDYPVPQQRLWDAFADPRQLERFWGPPTWPATFTRHDFQVGGRAEYFMTGSNGEKWSGSWKFTAVNPISSFEAQDGEDNAEDENMPSSMKFTFRSHADRIAHDRRHAVFKPRSNGAIGKGHGGRPTRSNAPTRRSAC